MRSQLSRPCDQPFQASPGTLEQWLTKRCCLYTLDPHQLVHRGEIHHPPWPLQPAQASIGMNTMGRQIDITRTEEPPLHYAKRQDVVFWALEHATRAGPVQAGRITHRPRSHDRYVSGGYL